MKWLVRFGFVSDPILHYELTSSFCLLFFVGKELENLAKEAGFSVAKHYELGGGLMGNLVATR